MKCRHCGSELGRTFLDLGFAPPSNAYLQESGLREPEITFPLKLCVCDKCWLVQTEDHAEADQLFLPDYAYFSSTSKSWLEHAEHYASTITKRLGLTKQSFVIEVASNDGYLLRNFVRAGIPCLGIEPTDSTADAAEKIGVPVLRTFFGVASATVLAKEGKRADLICGNNVYAHVPDINDFTQGLRIALKEGGTINLEFPHLMQLIDQNQFDTIYHEHFSYLSFMTVEKVFAAHGLTLFDVEELGTHGGSLRIYGRHTENSALPVTERANELRQREIDAGFARLETYSSFTEQVKETKRGLLEFLINAKRAGKTIVGYGAPGKGNTLLNYCGIRQDFVDYTVDRSPYKQGKYTPGTHIPIYSPDRIRETKPDYLLILPWNLKDEIASQMAYIREWGGKFVIPIPKVEVF